MRKRILVVDDIPILTQSIGEMLMMENYEVTLAYNGEEALLLCIKEVRDLILTDLFMPIMGGLELVKSIRSGCVHNIVPIIILTADTSEGIQHECKNASANLVMHKPFDDNLLLSIIHNFIAPWLRRIKLRSYLF